MKKSKKNNLSPKKGIAKNKRVLIIIIILFVTSLGIIGFSLSKRDNIIYKENTRYFTGNLYTANHAANMLDYVYENDNIIISPYNVNYSLAVLYNATDNNSHKELKSYFKKNLETINNEIIIKEQNLVSEEKLENKFTKLYENYIKEIYNKTYDNLTIDTIKLLSDKEKQEILLLIKKASLTYERMNNLNKISEKEIKNYKLTSSETTSNDYHIKESLDNILDDYESYIIKNEVVNYTEVYSNNIKVKEEFKKEIKPFNISITELKNNNLEDTKTINDNIKSITSDNITRVVSEEELTSNELIIINTLHFNYGWEESFTSDKVSDTEFYKFNNEVSAVEMMYGKETSYYENKYAKAFSKDFENGKYSYIGILPNSTEDFSLSSLNIDDLLLSKKNKNVLIGIPKITYQSEIDIEKIVSNYNVNEVFNENTNLTKMTEDKAQISKMSQKIKITIGEKGTVINEMNKKTYEGFSEEEYEDSIILNRPYAYLIRNNETNEIILIGKVISPNESS